VGGYIETLGRVDSPFRSGIVIDSYVNEEGWILGLPILMSFNGVYGVDGKGSFAGNIVFVGSNDMGESVPLTDEEIEYIRLSFDQRTFSLLPKVENPEEVWYL
jgi:hypothetical protein